MKERMLDDVLLASARGGYTLYTKETHAQLTESSCKVLGCSTLATRIAEA
jgi:hypothetical protein